jgi:ABC-2 type transport system permease protein
MPEETATMPDEDATVVAVPSGERAATRGRRGWLRDAARITRMDLRCTLRRLRAHPRTVLARTAVLAVAWVGFFGDGGVLATGGTPAVAETRLAAAGLWLFVAATVAMSAPRSLDDVEVGTELVLSAGVRATVVGMLAVTAVESAAVFVAFVGFGALRVTLASAEPLLASTLGLGTVLVGIASAVTAGFATGLAVHPLARRTPGFERHPRAVFVPVLGLVVVALLRPDVVGPVGRALPPAFFADAFLFAFGDGIRALGALALVGGVVSVPAFTWIGERAARTVWFDGDDTGGSGSTRGRWLVAAVVNLARPVTRRPTRAVATRAWLRMLRNPRTLFQLVVPAFMLGAVLVQDPPGVAGALPVLVAGFAGVSAGLTLTLNPLALEGDALPALLTTPVAGSSVARGYVFAGVLAALPTLLVLVPPLAYVTGLAPGVTVLTVAWGVLVAAFGAVASTAVGFVVPSSGAAATGDTEAPTQAAVLVYTPFAFVAAAFGMAGLLALGSAIGRALLAGDVLLLATLGGLAYWHVVRRYEALTIDD